jgi:serralysin
MSYHRRNGKANGLVFPRFCMEPPSVPKVIIPKGAGEMAAETRELWNPGGTLRVKFLDGAANVQNAVMRTIAEWSQYANIKFRRVTYGPAEIRVTLRPGPSWSMVGTDCLQVPAGQATMQLGWQDTGTWLHEFGHSLGLIHEHQSPAEGIPWNREAVYAFYAAPPNRWSRATVDSQVFAKYAEGITNTAWDRLSIMEYPIPAALITDPRYAVGWNHDLSETDKSFIALLYPKG